MGALAAEGENRRGGSKVAARRSDPRWESDLDASAEPWRIVAVAGLIFLLLIVASMVWVGYDAKKRDWSYKKHGSKTAAGQIIGVVLFWIIFFPVYLVQRRKAPLLVE